MNNMAEIIIHKGHYCNSAEIVLSEEDKDALTGRDRDKQRVKKLMNWIIWGDTKEFYE